MPVGVWKNRERKALSIEHRKKMSLASIGKLKSEKHKESLKLAARKRAYLMTGENHPLWKGGCTPLVHKIRHHFKYRQWRSDIFTRDNFTCCLCNKYGGKLNADHYPKLFSSIFHENKITSILEAENCEEFWNINNGRTLCIDCHNKTKKGFNKNMNK